MEQQYEDYTVPLKKVGFIANSIGTIGFIVLLAAYFMIWGLQWMSTREILLFFVATLAGLWIHEYIHAFAFWAFGKVKWSSIDIRAEWAKGVLVCHTDEEMRISAYRISVALPFIVLGIIPYIWIITTGGSIPLLYTAAAMIVGGVGDCIMLWLLRNVDGKDWVKDHPTEMGGQVRRGKQKEVQ